ncbi:apolipoprotein N-acyltransferase [uncultured Cocleimonas sp.]|uniref:apolipoprotein N-acyltransferase n=1 Tax=uncultured Cocleimonas sp. TaxID=1051587 RepID=UPI00261774AB|nr:apolipoprotein N-acyltransferase [uncultured Cocleimonas sp.]
MVLSFAPFNFFPVSYITLAVLFYLLILSNDRAQTVKLSWAFGIGLFGAGISWVFQSMYAFAQAPFLLAALFTFLFVLALALQIALFGLITSYFKKCSPVTKLLFVYPAAWVLIEWARGWLFTGFPWLYVGHSQIDTWFAHIAPVGGSLMVSWVVAIISGALVVIFTPRNNGSVLRLNRTAGTCVITFLVGTAWYLSAKDWIVPEGETLKVSLLQGNIAQEKKWLPENRVPSVERYMEMTRENWDSDLIVWPETAIPGRFADFKDFVLKPMQQEALDNNTNLLIGGFRETTDGQVENSTLVLGKNADATSFYSKRHLVPLGEYIPFLEYLRWLDRWINIPFNNLSKGEESGLLNIGKHQAQISICYEDVFGEEIIKDLPEADYLVNMTNDGWFSHSLQPYQHMQIARFRALESGRYLLRATNTGVSGIIDHKGKILHTMPAYEQGVVKGTITILSGTTPYVKYGNYLVVLPSFLLLMLIFLFMRRNY